MVAWWWYSDVLLHVMYYCSLEVILRAEAVETAQAGDKCDFIGTLIVVPDVASLSLPGKIDGSCFFLV